MIVDREEKLPPRLFQITSQQIGRSVETPLWFGFSLFTWWGECDPEKDGFKKIFGSLYYKRRVNP